MSVDSLSRRGARGGALVVSSQFVKIAVQAVGVITLSRLLTPSDFGIVAMVSVFIALGEILRDFGLPTAALQARELSRQQASNLFWLNSFLGFTAAALLAAATPLLVAMYSEDALSVVAPVMAGTLLLNGVQAQAQVQLARQMRYGTLASTDIAAQVLALCTAIVIAISGGGYWALVGQVLVASSALLILRSAALRTRPLLPRRHAGTKPLVVSGVQLGSAMVLTYAADNVDTLVIGITQGSAGLGYYNRAFQLFSIPRTGILSALTQVVLPVVNAAVNAGRAAFDVLLRVQFSLGFVLAWVYLFLAVGANWIIPLVLGSQWIESVPVFQVLCVAGAISSFSNTTYWAFVAEQKSSLLLRLHVITKPLIVVTVVCGAQFGIVGTAVGYSAGMLLSWPITVFWLAHFVDAHYWRFLPNAALVLAAGGVAFALGTATMYLTSEIGWMSQAVAAVVATVTYAAIIASTSSGRKGIRATLALANELRTKRAHREPEGGSK